ncbi:DUF6730 family protein [Flagellimonas lutaonensis]|uniref:Uncharacterized protein n=1 Tax=Flagellimonas lutaonensis TaxID=516051 RepID=A0A0D5YNV2_9FLAO|nr:DUF6730 family protein [Allomuricauda lutaonensis]AKA33907.1 hypothetical protein VC82_220 [Allomuricauda lutaonensis]
MAKLDEIAELLTEEIRSFGSWVTELKVLLKNIDEFGFEPDTSEMERLLNVHQSNLKSISEKQHQALDKALKNIDKSRLIPKWEVALIYTVMILNATVFGYFGYHYIQYEKQKETAYLEGKNEGLFKATQYFEDHPVIFKDYQEWVQKHDSITNQK